MYIKHADIQNYRALQSISISLNQFSVLIGENDVGKTSFLYALNAFFVDKKISDKDEFFKGNTGNDIIIQLTFSNVQDNDTLNKLKNSNGDIIIEKTFSHNSAPSSKVLLGAGETKNITKAILKEHFSLQSFHFIPVRRDLSVQFSMNKTALLGKTLRAKMKMKMEETSAKESLEDVTGMLKGALEEPRVNLESYLQEQLHNDQMKLNFDNVDVDPVEGISFNVTLTDDRVDNILIENRGAGTQNNLIIALFRLIAELQISDYFIFAMEEPENSLHPKAQRQLLAVLQEISTKSQVIVTTHSPVFIERSKFENNILLTRTIKGNTIAKTFNEELLGQLRADLGIRPSDALLKGGGNCAILVEGNTEEEGFPVFMEMLGMSEFRLGIAIINLRGSDKDKVRNTARLLFAYDISCVIVLDRDAKDVADDMEREMATWTNIRKVFCLKKGMIEDYYPLEIVAEVINRELKPSKIITVDDFDNSKSGYQRLQDFKRVMHENNAGSAIGYLKRGLGNLGTKLMQERDLDIDPEIVKIFETVKSIVESQ